ncbi:MAG: EboA family metabolite traffic protein [Calothrix sp. C42_A2020_038]|nr:EboA family metabolite traffic protein [Calothrix sp. C42_A2020_038]
MLATIDQNIQNILVANLLKNWLAVRVSIEAFNWLETKSNTIKASAEVDVFYTAFSAVPRYTGKQDLNLTTEELKASGNLHSGWFPINWSVDQATRVLLVLSLPNNNQKQYLQTLEQLFNAADVGELVTLYQALPILPYPEQLQKRAAEGVRSNMTAVFNAVALNNPYPSEYFDNLAWNQMVLKALFVNSPLHQIQGLEQRTNPQLAQMLSDYASERQAAKRIVAPELWQLLEKCTNKN